MALPDTRLDKALDTLLSLVRENPALVAEFEASVREFQPHQDAASSGAALLAARRHLEWFLLERHSPALFGVPVEALLGPWRKRAAANQEAMEEALLGSFTGVFEIGEVRAEGVWLSDLAGLGQYALGLPGGNALAEGDVVVGRLFPIGGGLHAGSPTLAVLTDPDVLRALRADIERLRDERAGGKVLHISQKELEAMFFGPAPEAREGPVHDPLAEARKLLEEHGVADTERIFARLAALPFDPNRLVHGAGDGLAEILDELAFTTRIDLTEARGRLIEAWAVLAGGKRGTAGQAAAGDAARDSSDERRAAVEAFVRGRQAGRDLESLLSDLERDLELTDADAPGELEEGAEAPAPDFPGVVGAMIEEFLWETGRAEGEERAAELARLRSLGPCTEKLGLFEELSARELLHYATFWLHERGELDGEQDARALVEALSAFCIWADEAHALHVAAEFEPVLEGLRSSLPRVAMANRFTDAGGDTERPGELYEFRSPGVLLDAAGGAHDDALAPELIEHLAAGDRLRARRDEDGTLTVLCVYPPEVAGLAVR